ncbi:PAAR domain-containing protein, partial [Pectobacterium versatile]
RSISSGSSSVLVDGKPAARTGDGVSCGGVLIGGGTVTIG